MKAMAERQMMAVKELRPDPAQPRKAFDKEKLAELAETMKTQGILVDLLVRADNGHVLIVDGERRWRAAQLAGLEKVPVRYVEMKGTATTLAAQVILNQQRENLSALEEAGAIARALELGQKAGKSADAVAKDLGISRSTMFGKARLAAVSAPVKAALEKGEISASVAGLVAMAPAEKHKEIVDDWKGDHYQPAMSFRDAKEDLERNHVKSLGAATFSQLYDYGEKYAKDPRSKQLVSATCESCPKRSGNMEGSGLTNKNVCTAPDCYDLKTALNQESHKAEAAEKGKLWIEGKDAEKLFNKYSNEHELQSAQYVELDARCDSLGEKEKRHWRALLKDQAQVTIAVDPAGHRRELVRRSAAEAVLTARGFKVKKVEGREHGYGYDSGNWQKEEARKKARKALCRKIAQLATAEILKQLVRKDGSPTPALWPRLALAVAESLRGEDSELSRRRGLKGYTGPQKWAKDPKRTAREYVELVVEGLLCEDPWDWNGKWQKEYVDLCQLAGVNLKKLEAASQKETKKTKKKGK